MFRLMYTELSWIYGKQKSKTKQIKIKLKYGRKKLQTTEHLR